MLIFKGDIFTGLTENKQQVINNGTEQAGDEEGEDGSPAMEIQGNTAGNIINYGIAAGQSDWIYYRNEDDGYKIYNVGTDGNGRKSFN